MKKLNKIKETLSTDQTVQMTKMVVFKQAAMGRKRIQEEQSSDTSDDSVVKPKSTIFDKKGGSVPKPKKGSNYFTSIFKGKKDLRGLTEEQQEPDKKSSKKVKPR